MALLPLLILQLQQPEAKMAPVSEQERVPHLTEMRK